MATNATPIAIFTERKHVSTQIVHAVRGGSFESLQAAYDEAGYPKLFASALLVLKAYGIIPDHIGK